MPELDDLRERLTKWNKAHFEPGEYHPPPQRRVADRAAVMTGCANMKKPACLADVTAEQAGTLTSEILCVGDDDRLLPPVVIRPVLLADDAVSRGDLHLASAHGAERVAAIPAHELVQLGDEVLGSQSHCLPFLSGRSDLSPLSLANGLSAAPGRVAPDQGFYTGHWQESPGQRNPLTRVSVISS